MTRPIKRPWSPRAARAGMISLVNLIALLFCALLAVLLLNSVSSVRRKQALQNAADDIAHSAAQWHARGLNAITAANHQIGEMVSLLVLHEAVGGRRIGRVVGDTRRADAQLDAAYDSARQAGCATPAYSTVREQRGVRAEMTLLDAKRNLKEKLTHVYIAKIAARASGVGAASEAALTVLELAILEEYLFLSRWHVATVALIPEYEFLLRTALPDAKEYTALVVRDVPRLCLETARQIAERNGVEAVVHPLAAALPVVPDPLGKSLTLAPIRAEWYAPAYPKRYYPPPAGVNRVAITRDQIVKVTQLARAAFPWVNYHRQPLLDMLENRAPLSGAKDLYFEYSTGCSKSVCDRLQMERDLWLYMLKNPTSPDKGFERWTDDPVLADEVFGLVGIASIGPVAPLGSADVFAHEHPEGQIAWSQALVYNANPQQRHAMRIDLRTQRIVPIRQAGVGWDTLNWWSPDKEPPFELIGKGSLLRPEYPSIRVNWQAKLVPSSSSRMNTLQRDPLLPASVRPEVNRLLTPIPQSLLTH